MDDISSIVSFRSGGTPPASEAKVETPVAVEAPAEPKGDTEAASPAARERDEAGKFKAKEEAAAAAVVAEAKAEAQAQPVVPDKPTGGQLAALMAERAKRQQLEARIAELEAGKTEKPDIFTEPERVVRDLVAQEVGSIKEDFFVLSIERAQDKYDDFQSALENCSKLMDANPALAVQLRGARNPGEFIYQVGSNTPEHREAQAAKTRDELSAKDSKIAALTAELEAVKKSQQARSDVPESLNRQPSGAVPNRDDDSDITKIVRFKSG